MSGYNIECRDFSGVTQMLELGGRVPESQTWSVRRAWCKAMFVSKPTVKHLGFQSSKIGSASSSTSLCPNLLPLHHTRGHVLTSFRS